MRLNRQQIKIKCYTLFQKKKKKNSFDQKCVRLRKMTANEISDNFKKFGVKL